MKFPKYLYEELGLDLPEMAVKKTDGEMKKEFSEKMAKYINN